MTTSSVITRMPRACAAAMKRLRVGERAVVRMHAAIVGDVVAVVAPRRGIERQQPDRVDAEIGDVVELGDQARKVADAVVVRIEERLDVQLVDDRVLVPQRVLGQRGAIRRADGRRRYPSRRLLAGAIRQIAKGRSAGSRRMRWRLPVQTNRWPRIRSSAATDASIRQAPLPQRNFDRSLPAHVRIEADRHQDHVVSARPPLAVEQHLVVERRIEGHAEMALQRRIRAADAVERRDLRHDVARRGEVPHADLVFLGIEIFLAARQRRRLRRARSRNTCPTGPTACRPAPRGSESRAGPRSAGRAD